MINFYNRKTGKYEVEQVAGESYINWIYSSPLGMKFLELFLKKKMTSRIFGYYCDKAISKTKIQKFVDEFKVDMSCFDIPEKGYKTFNEFFYRKFQKGKIQITSDKNSFISPCEGKVLAYENIDVKRLIQIKGITYSLAELIGSDTIDSSYAGGSCLIFRLCPSDYHRIHFVDHGTCSPTTKIKGFYYSVNPTSLSRINKIFCSNKREWSILSSENFGEILYVEVGATFVGSIIQTYPINEIVKRGDEKGYFKFGGSTVILFLKKDVCKIDKDILDQTSEGMECSVSMGERIGSR
ncbi:phosphatidylserine decarboxylase [Desulfosporosinus fructosivorans]|uniref:Phosphatidylserine decarboxylase proenzyme n=1 Tax=Desulfosporosinus fructosivorans TaxID=2018669 RepID=A0A4Z0R810_9FIRM|nr:phosphatidylserine decarboxylase [Desulfosporosinus fructosivorans]TGE38940.1 phosphatidylserine decarboxylase [Desulfosporosinus fructosivorans]